MPVICLVRHGQASFGADDYDALSDVGREQSTLAGAELARRGLRTPLLVCGTLRRQRDTAARLGLGDAQPHEDPRWNEYDHIELVKRYRERSGRAADGGDSRAFQQHLDVALLQWIEGREVDGWEAFSTDAVDALHAVRRRTGPRGDAVVVTSGGVIAAVVGALLGAPPEGIVALNRMMVNASTTTVLVGSTGLNLLSYNEHAHLGPLRTYR
jgi:broad specificity phosphatase PhoE